MLNFLIAFISGFFIPFIARRLGKILPTTTGVILFRLLHCPRFPKSHNPLHYRLFLHKWGELFLNAFLFGLSNALSFFVANIYLPTQMLPYAYAFMWIILCSANVDLRFFILPDCLTIPLILIGFLFATHSSIISPQQSIYGACFAYLITAFSVFLLSFTNHNLFGAGDSKMAIALGTWLGIQGLNYTIFSSFFLFILYAFFTKKRCGAYGPALGIAGLFCFFLIYAK